MLYIHIAIQSKKHVFWASIVRRVVCFVDTNISKKLASSLLRVETYSTIKANMCSYIRDKWVLVTTVWRVRKLRVEERPSIWWVDANVLN